jgi:hypothetical protein
MKPVLAFAVFSAAWLHLANAVPAVLECSTFHMEVPSGDIYQVTFDTGISTVSVNGGPPVKAEISATMIKWTDSTGTWQVDRTSGKWSKTVCGGFMYMCSEIGGWCRLAPAPKF